MIIEEQSEVINGRRVITATTWNDTMIQVSNVDPQSIPDIRLGPCAGMAQGIVCPCGGQLAIHGWYRYVDDVQHERKGTILICQKCGTAS